MKESNSKYGRILLACASGVIMFLMFVAAAGCKKDPKHVPIDLNSVNGRWCQVQDTTAHFYIDSLSTSSAVVRYPAIAGASIETYARIVYSAAISGDTVYLHGEYNPGSYKLFRVSDRWHGWTYIQNAEGKIQRVAIHQVNNDTLQPGPVPIPEL